MANDFSVPRTSVNHRRMKRIPRSSTVRRTYSASSVKVIVGLLGVVGGKPKLAGVAPRYAPVNSGRSEVGGYDGAVISPEVLGQALEEAPDPQLARVTISRIEQRSGARDVLTRPDVLEAATPLLGYSHAAADFFLAHPDELT